MTDDGGTLTIHLDVGKRITTAPGKMKVDNPPQKRASELPGAEQQALAVMNQARRIGKNTRNFSIRPARMFQQYGCL